jgi:hypothetical protein
MQSRKKFRTAERAKMRMYVYIFFKFAAAGLAPQPWVFSASAKSCQSAKFIVGNSEVVRKLRRVPAESAAAKSEALAC